MHHVGPEKLQSLFWELLKEDANFISGLVYMCTVCICVCLCILMLPVTHRSSGKDFKVNLKQETLYGCRHGLFCVSVLYCLLQPPNLLKDVFRNVR